MFTDVVCLIVTISDRTGLKVCSVCILLCGSGDSFDITIS